MVPVLEGKHVRLREWRADELAAMHRWLSDPDVTRYLSFGADTLEDSAQHLALCLAEQDHEQRIRYYLAVELREDGSCIGDAGFEWRDPGRQEGEFGYFLLPEYWGQGIGTECARLVLQLAFDHCGARAMRASCNEKNLASEGVMRKCGLHRDLGAESPGRRSYRIEKSEWIEARQ